MKKLTILFLMALGLQASAQITTHPAIVNFKGQWLFFSHNGGLPDGTSYSRSIIAEPVSYDNNGRIRRIPATAEGVSIR